MTVQEWLKGQLESCGMFDNQADAVIERVKADKGAPGMHWSDQKDSYPDVLYATLMLTAARHAVDYIDETTPRAGYRPVFAQIAGREQAHKKETDK